MTEVRRTGQRYFFDTEFWERGPAYPIALLSIGIVADDGREFYAVNADAPWGDIETSPDADWLRRNVVPHLGNPGLSLEVLRYRLKEFFTPRPSELWAYFADYDHVVLCQIFGRMIDLPDGMPMYTHDLKQELDRRNLKKEHLPPQKGTEHNALEDARWVRDAHRVLG